MDWDTTPTTRCPVRRASRIGVDPAEALCRIEVGQLGSGMGALPMHEQPGVLRPGGKRYELGQFRDHLRMPDDERCRRAVCGITARTVR